MPALPDRPMASIREAPSHELVALAAEPEGAAAAAPARPAEDGTAQAVLRELLGLDLCNLTPLQALNLLAALQQRARESRR
jgi:hypothetical protein